MNMCDIIYKEVKHMCELIFQRRQYNMNNTQLYTNVLIGSYYYVSNLLAFDLLAIDKKKNWV